MSNMARIVSAFIIGISLLQPAIAEDEPEKFDESAERLRELLQNAAESGYVSIRGEEKPASPKVDPEPVSPGSGVQARSLRFGADDELVADKTKCELAEVFNFDAFKQSPTYDDIFKLRNDFISVRGVYDPETGLVLAKSYLALAMPEEASALTELVASESIQLASQMARVLSGAEESTSSELSSYISCTDKAGLWTAAALVKEDPARALELTKEHITEIGQLPADLQFFFSTQLGILAAEREEYELAIELLTKLRKIGRTDDTAVLYLESLIGTRTGEQASLALLKQVAQTQGPLQAKALFSLGEASETTPYKNYAKDLELVSAQYRGLSESDLAKQMNVRFLAEESLYQQAIDFSVSHFPDLDSNRTLVRDSVAAILLKRLMSEDDIVKFHSLNNYTNNISFFSGFPDEIHLRVSAVEAALHFELPHLLLPLMEGFDFSSMQRQIDFVSARAALLNERADLAWSICSLHEGDPDFDVLSVEAAVALNDPEAALSVLSRLPPSDEIRIKSARIAWQFGLWDEARDHYAEILVASNDTNTNDRHNLAAYMSGELGGFHALKASADLLEIESLFDSYREEKPKLREYLANG